MSDEGLNELPKVPCWLRSIGLPVFCQGKFFNQVFQQKANLYNYTNCKSHGINILNTQTKYALAQQEEMPKMQI